MCNQTPPSAPPADLPPQIVSLARRVARDCKAPGRYVVELTVPPHAGDKMQVEISRKETISKA